MSAAVVENLYTEYRNLINFLDDNNEISLRVTVDGNFRKSLLLAAASHFEHRICTDIADFAEEISGTGSPVLHFVKNKAISRQYHTFFQWDGKNANQFFGLFGDTFLSLMKEVVKTQPELSESIKAFLELGLERNRLVHQDFGAYTLEKTADEIYYLYQKALPFVVCIPEKLRNCAVG